MTYPTAIVHQGDALTVLRTLPDESVHCVVTSPPYYGLRDYQTGTWVGGDESCDHKAPAREAREFRASTLVGTKTTQAVCEAGTQAYRDICGKCGARRVAQQIGLEATVGEWIAALVAVFAEVRRVLRRDGTVWLNVGDCYVSAPSGSPGAHVRGEVGDGAYKRRRERMIGDGPDPQKARGQMEGFKPKDQMLLPHRLAIALCDDGWWIRSTIVWSKVNPMPESVTDRPTTSHEYLFLLSRCERYYYDADAVREPNETDSLRRSKTNVRGRIKANRAGLHHTDEGMPSHFETMECNPAGRNRRTVWEIPSEAYPFAHFATYPRALVRPCILAGTSARGVCGKCEAPWRRVVEKGDLQPLNPKKYDKVAYGDVREGHNGFNQGSNRARDGHRGGMAYENRTTGWRPSCRCECPDTVPAVCLDPFAGSGTTGEVALSLGRSAVLIELSPEYVKLIEKRLSRAQVPLMLEDTVGHAAPEPAEPTQQELWAAD